MTETQPVSPLLTPKKAKKKETPGEMFRSFAFAVLLALLFRSVAYEPFHIPSGSMLSTLYEGDYIFVSKLSYGYSRYSFPFSPDMFGGERVLGTMPARGDVVVFRNPVDTSTDYIKRVIGLPGDRVQMKHDRLYINGTLVEQTRRGDVTLPDSQGQMHAIPRYEETLPGGRSHVVLDANPDNQDPTTGFNSDNTAVYTVPEGHFFMMGDNRDNSQDSRFSKELGYGNAPGFVPFENLIGRAEIIAFSWKGEPGRWLKSIL
ncbi:MAG: signal peptidase I [Pseudomonadota bacterium]